MKTEYHKRRQEVMKCMISLRGGRVNDSQPGGRGKADETGKVSDGCGEPPGSMFPCFRGSIRIIFPGLLLHPTLTPPQDALANLGEGAEHSQQPLAFPL